MKALPVTSSVTDQEFYGPIVHGSDDSLDRDVFYVFKTLPDRVETLHFAKDSTEEDRCVIEIDPVEGVVCNSSKGRNDTIIPTF